MIFLSYRRSDTAGHAGRLFDRIANRFGRDQVFMDVDTLQPGEDFAREIARQIDRSDVVIALIGDQWVSATDAKGYRRLDDSADYVRAEIAAALERGVTVIPVLVEGARMPIAEQLPAALRGLAQLQALEISDHRFDSEAQELLEAIARRLPKPTDGGAKGKVGWPKALRLVLSLAMILVLAGGVWMLRRPAARPELAGRWVAEVADPAAKPFTLLFDFQPVGNRILGSVTFPTGEGGIRTGQVEGNRVEFTTEHLPDFQDHPASIRFAAEFHGQELRGVVQDEHRARTFVARRETR